MGKRVMTIATIMIIVLILLLVVVFVNFFNNNKREIDNKLNNVSGDFFIDNDGNKEPELKKLDNELSGDTVVDKIASTTDEAETDKNGEKEQVSKIEPAIETTVLPSKTQKATKTTPTSDTISVQAKSIEDASGDVIPNTVEEDNGANKLPVEAIISSDTETSNQDKQQVLSEIDDALQGLLEAVGNVPIVDEEKLNKTLESSEVTPWRN